MSFLSRLHSGIRSARHTRHGASVGGHGTPRGAHKTYPRFTQIPLPEPLPTDVSLSGALKKRRSALGGNPNTPFTADEIGTVLGLALRVHSGSTRRPYPSGGGLYPVETYLLSTAFESRSPAVYHYNPTEHTLELLLELPADFDMKQVAKLPHNLPLSALILFTSVWNRSAVKYGDLAYAHALLEAGHMSENVLLVSGALNLEARPYAGFSDTLVAQLLDLDTEKEQPIHAITLCKQSSTSNKATIED